MSLASQIKADSPLGYWRLDELSGTVALDGSGNGRHGTYDNTPDLGVAGPAGMRAATFKAASSESCTIGTSIAALNVATLTVEAWVKLTTASVANPIFDVDASDSNSLGRGYHLLITSGNRLSLRKGSGDGSWESVTGTATTFATGAWYHVAATYNGTSTFTMYVNGATEASTVSNDTAGISFTNTNYTGIAQDPSGSNPSVYGDLSLAQVAVYGSVLSADRIAAHYAAGLRSGVVSG